MKVYCSPLTDAHKKSEQDKAVWEMMYREYDRECGSFMERPHF